MSLKKLEATVNNCTKCELHKNRIQTVFGQVVKDSKILFIGEGPGYMEDMYGEPFVGPSGHALNKKLVEYGFLRRNVSVLNIVKCKPPMNRVPKEDEIFWCYPYLLEQIKFIKPIIIVPLGKTATWTMLAKKTADFTNPKIKDFSPMYKFFGQIFTTKISKKEYKIIPVYHPAYWLRNTKRTSNDVNIQFTLIRKCFDGNSKKSA